MAFVKIVSWHVIDRVSQLGWHTRCGKLAEQGKRVSDQLHVEDKSCETCLRLTVNDTEQQPENDEVPG